MNEELLKETHAALKSIMIWIDNWSPNFIHDPEWYDEYVATTALLDKVSEYLDSVEKQK